MNISELEGILENLCEQDSNILLVMLVSNDGLPLCHAGVSADFDTTGALYTELKLLCEQILSNLHLGAPEHIFVRAKAGCVDIWPVADLGVLACMTQPGINTQRLQILAWKTVASLLRE